MNNLWKMAPVTFKFFKKHTYHEECAEFLLKLTANGDQQLYERLLNNEETKERALKAYFEAFYLKPKIREKYLIRFKSVPKKIKDKLLSIPVQGTGSIVSALQEQDGAVCINDIENLDVINENVDKVAKQNKRMTQDILVRKDVVIDDEPGPSTSRGAVTAGHVLEANNCLKRPSRELVESPSPKRQATGASTSSAVDVAHNNVCLKKPSTEVVESPPPKRKAIEKKTPSLKKLCKDLSCYIDYCPVTLEDFVNYSNIKELYRLVCQVHGLNINSLDVLLKRAYILFYLVPEKRTEKPLSKFQVSDNCPLHLREKMLSIPEYPKGNNQKKPCSKPKVKILDNRLLVPIKRPLPEQGNSMGLCLDKTCVFYHLTYNDMKENTDIILQSASIEATVHENIFKQIIYKMIKQLIYKESFEAKYMIKTVLVCKLFKHNAICAKCESEASSASSGTVAESDRNAPSKETEANKNPIENKEPVTQSPESDNMEETPSKVGSVPVTRKSMESAGIKSPETITSESSYQPTIIENLAAPNVSRRNNCFANEKSLDLTIANEVQNMEGATQPFVNELNNKSLFSKFSQRLIKKFEESMDNTVDFASESYKVFLECNEIPLAKILNQRPVFAENEEYLQIILNAPELLDVLQRYYYFQYITNDKFALKYPVEPKPYINKSQEADDKTTRNSLTLDTTNQNENSSLNFSITIHDEIEEVRSLNQLKLSSNNSALEKAKRIFFRAVDRTQTLPYVLRTTSSYKEYILRLILDLTYDEFLDLTNVYEGKELYNDKQLTECMYRYVFREPMVWPTNLFITLKDLCDFLRKKNVVFESYDTMLLYISPKLLHWSNLLTCTNILDCVKSDYEKRTGKLLDTNDISTLKPECIDYYNRCCKYDKWQQTPPMVNEEFCNNEVLEDEVMENIVVSEDPVSVSTSQELRQETITTTDADANKLHSPKTSMEDFVMTEDPPTVSRTQQQAEDATTITDADANIVHYIDDEVIVYVTAEEPTTNTITTIDAKTRQSPNTNNDVIELSSCSEDPEEFGCVLLPNTQQQIEMLPAEENYPIDPLNPTNNIVLPFIVSQPVESNESCDVVSAGKVIEIVKTEPIDNKLLKNLIFYEDDKNIMHCKACKDEVINLAFNDTIDNLLEGNFLSLKNTNAADTHCLHSSLEFGQNTITQFSDEIFSVTNQQQSQRFSSSVEETLTQSVSTNPQESQRFPSPVEENQTQSESTVSPQQQKLTTNTRKTNEDIIDALIDKQPVIASTSKASCKSSFQTFIQKQGPQKKSNKNVATVKPLTNTILVPQIQHTTRPLQTVPISNSNDNEAQIVPPSMLTLNLTPTRSSSQSSSNQSSQNSTIQLQLPNCETRIFISQELNKNCSVFDNSSLLRIVDHNYNKQSTNNSTQNNVPNSEQPTTSTNITNQQEEEVTTPLHYVFCDNNTLADDKANNTDSVNNSPKN